jgi:hypothetical protein
MNAPSDEQFARLIGLLQLRDISPMELHSRRLGNAPSHGAEVQLQWKQSLADGDPVSGSPDTRIFRPRYELSVKHGVDEFFHHVSVFIVAFSVKDQAAFDELWTDESLRKAFTERQLRRTLWPIFRQHVLDGMTRLGMPPVVLPWLM